MLEQTINHFQSWREAHNLVNGENMYALGLPISVHSTAPEDPVGSQESDDMKYVAINDTIVLLDQPEAMALMSGDITGDYRHYTALCGTDANESQEHS